MRSVQTVEGLTAKLAKAFSQYGIDHFIIAGLPNPDERFEKAVVLKHWSSEWYDVYTKKNFAQYDPVIRMCRGTSMPFEWDQAPFDKERELQARELMRLASDFGLVKGFSVPVHGSDGFEACFSVSGARPELDVGSKSAMHMIALYSFEKLRSLASAPPAKSPLTLREKEVLTWVALGKSHAEIADILVLTERTVTAHTINATRKLGAANKTHAVVRAMQARFISV